MVPTRATPCAPLRPHVENPIGPGTEFGNKLGYFCTGRLGLVKKLDIWIPHELKEIHLIKRINTCDLNLKRNEFDPFLKRIITGDEK